MRVIFYIIVFTWIDRLSAVVSILGLRIVIYFSFSVVGEYIARVFGIGGRVPTPLSTNRQLLRAALTSASSGLASHFSAFVRLPS